MELLETHGQYKEYFPGVMTESLKFAESKLSYDSRYRSIIGQLDAMIKSLRQQPDRILTTEMDHLLDAMMHHIAPENNFMELVGYPQVVKHRNHHQYLFIITDDLNQSFRMGQNVLLEELINLRLFWLIHIQIHDQAFEEFLVSPPVRAGNV